MLKNVTFKLGALFTSVSGVSFEADFRSNQYYGNVFSSC